MKKKKIPAGAYCYSFEGYEKIENATLPPFYSIKKTICSRLEQTEKESMNGYCTFVKKDINGFVKRCNINNKEE
jgi:hypothetical protein